MTKEVYIDLGLDKIPDKPKEDARRKKSSSLLVIRGKGLEEKQPFSVIAPDQNVRERMIELQKYIDQSVNNISRNSGEMKKEQIGPRLFFEETDLQQQKFHIPGLGSPSFNIRDQVLEKIVENELESREMSRRVSKTQIEISKKSHQRLSKRKS